MNINGIIEKTVHIGVLEYEVTLTVEEVYTVGVVGYKSAVALVIHIHTEVIKVHILAVHAHDSVCRTVNKNEILEVDILGIYRNHRALVARFMGEHKAQAFIFSLIFP